MIATGFWTIPRMVIVVQVLLGVLAFLVLSRILLLFFMKKLRRRNAELLREKHLIPGQVAYVTQEIHPLKPGRITFAKDDMKILCEAYSDEKITVGSTVVIVKSEDFKTRVKPLKEA